MGTGAGAAISKAGGMGGAESAFLSFFPPAKRAEGEPISKATTTRAADIKIFFIIYNLP
jgi:hypothetical protein